MKKVGFIIVLAVFAVLIGSYFIAGTTYSEGNRAGYLIKISNKGVVFKTYEGQLDLSGIGASGDIAAGSNIWEFSILDKSVYDELQKYEGRKVSLSYKERFKSFSWQGDTNYFVNGVEPLPLPTSPR